MASVIELQLGGNDKKKVATVHMFHAMELIQTFTTHKLRIIKNNNIELAYWLSSY